MRLWRPLHDFTSRKAKDMGAWALLTVPSFAFAVLMLMAVPAFSTQVGILTGVVITTFTMWAPPLAMILSGNVVESAWRRWMLYGTLVLGVGLMIAISVASIYQAVEETDYSGSFFCDVIG